MKKRPLILNFLLFIPISALYTCNFYSKLNDDQLTICKINVKVRSMDIQRQLIKWKIDLVIKHVNNWHLISYIFAAEVKLGQQNML